MDVQTNSFLTIPSKPATQNQARRVGRTKFELPPADGDALIPYVTTIKQDSPICSFCIGGINFDRYVLPSEASLQGNEGKRYPSKYIVRLLTEKQVEAIKKRAEELVLVVPKRQNLKFKGDKEKEPEYLDAQEFKASEIMILMPVDKFNPIGMFGTSVFESQVEKEEKKEMLTKDVLYKEQRKAK